MAGSVNKVILIGNLGRDPEVRTTSAGNKIVNLSLATSESWKDKNSGERREQTEWHRVVIFNSNLAEVAERMLQKGTKLYIEGQLRTRKYQNAQGQDTYTTEVVLNNMGSVMVILADAKPREGGDGGGNYASGGTTNAAPREEISVDQIGDDIPF